MKYSKKCKGCEHLLIISMKGNKIFCKGSGIYKRMCMLKECPLVHKMPTTEVEF